MSNSDGWLRRLCLLGLGLSVLLILVATLYPFRLVPAALYALPDTLKIFLRGKTDAGDLGSNILLFLPLGMTALGTWLMRQTHPTPRRQGFGKVVILSLLLSLGVEAVQFLIPSRTSSVMDVLANSLGGGLGAIAALWLDHGVRQALQREMKRLRQGQPPFSSAGSRASRRQVAIGLVLWMLLAWVTTQWLNQQSLLTNWDPNYDLNVGHSGRTNHPWQGEILEISWWDRRTDLTHPAAPPQRRESQRLSSLSEQLFHYQSGETLRSVGQEAVRSLIQQSSAFTFQARFSAENLDGAEPAGLFSFSWDAWNSNWVVMRWQRDLWVMLRAPVTAKHHHRWIYLTLPDLFQDTQVHDLTLSYDNAVLRAAWDGELQPRTLNLKADRILGHYFLPLNFSAYRLKPWGELLSQLAFYGLWMIPTGVMLSRLRRRERSPSPAFYVRQFVIFSLGFASILLWGQQLGVESWGEFLLLTLGAMVLGGCIEWGGRAWFRRWVQWQSREELSHAVTPFTSK